MTSYFTLRFQHRLDDAAGVHLLEGLVPFAERPDAADDRFDVQQARREQSDDALPDRPVVAEASLQRWMFFCTSGSRLIPIERLRAPADLADPARWAAPASRAHFERGRNAGGIDHAVDPQPIALACPVLDARRRSRRAAVLLGDFRTGGRSRSSPATPTNAPCKRAIGGAQQSDRPGTEAPATRSPGLMLPPVIHHRVVGHCSTARSDTRPSRTTSVSGTPVQAFAPELRT